jgi:hypothetical protein
MILESVHVRVQRGYQWLKTEGLARGLDVTRLNPDTLDVADILNCPMAQTSGGTFGSGMRLAGRGVDIEWAIAHGFMPTNGDFGIINSVWRDVIAADRSLSHAAA